jgi:hypothetical protein
MTAFSVAAFPLRGGGFQPPNSPSPPPFRRLAASLDVKKQSMCLRGAARPSGRAAALLGALSGLPAAVYREESISSR